MGEEGGKGLPTSTNNQTSKLQKKSFEHAYLQQKLYGEHTRAESKHYWRNTARGELILNKISVVQFDCWMCQPQISYQLCTKQFVLYDCTPAISSAWSRPLQRVGPVRVERGVSLMWHCVLVRPVIEHTHSGGGASTGTRQSSAHAHTHTCAHTHTHTHTHARTHTTPHTLHDVPSVAEMKEARYKDSRSSAFTEL